MASFSSPEDRGKTFTKVDLFFGNFAIRLAPFCGPGVGLLDERIVPRSGLPPLLTNLGDRPPEALHYLGTSFGLTPTLFNFWRKAGYGPVYLRQNASDITGAQLWPPVSGQRAEHWGHAFLVAVRELRLVVPVTMLRLILSLVEAAFWLTDFVRTVTRATLVALCPRS